MNWSGKLLILTLIITFFSCNNNNKSLPPLLKNSIIPSPQELKERPGFFTLKKNTKIYVDLKFKSEVALFCRQFNWLSTIELTVVENESNSANKEGIFILHDEETDSSNNNGYHLNISDKAIIINSISKAGIANGLQSVYQLILLNQRNNASTSGEYLIPALSINDWAKFEHRGLLLDCSRHFFNLEIVKKYIDLLAFYKMNVLHLHLTDDQGWRIEIDKYPKLMEVGAWRTEKNGERYGGFYTKEEIREIVSYAQERHITVIPEIELPGHSQAAIASYPYLSCTGEQVDVINDWGVYKEIYCAGNDSVFNFIKDVLTEVMELFPSQYMHIGGDETPKYRWEHCKKCQKRMLSEGLKDEHELQSYFINRVEKFLNKNGRELIGWDEILEGGLSENATLQSWRGFEGGIVAANANHNVIMSPTSHAYFDYDLKAIDLEKVYNFNPIPEELTDDKQQFIIGGECNLWSEHIPDEKTLDRQVFPRLMAMSEVLWNTPIDRNYADFYNQLQTHYPILDLFQVQYGLETLPAAINVNIDSNKTLIHVKPGTPDLEITYKWITTTSASNQEYKPLTTSLEIYKQESDLPPLLSVQALKNGVPYGDPIEQPFQYHKALHKKINYQTSYNKWYAAGGDLGLVDGKLGTTDFRDGNWQGFWGKDAELLLDLGKEQYISELSINCYQYNNAWIFFPANVEFSVSLDGVKYSRLPIVENEKIGPKKRGKFIDTYKTEFERQQIKFVKVKVTNLKKIPDWHEAAGSDAWIFIDEIIVK